MKKTVKITKLIIKIVVIVILISLAVSSIVTIIKEAIAVKPYVDSYMEWDSSDDWLKEYYKSSLITTLKIKQRNIIICVLLLILSVTCTFLALIDFNLRRFICTSKVKMRICVEKIKYRISIQSKLRKEKKYKRLKSQIEKMESDE